MGSGAFSVPILLALLEAGPNLTTPVCVAGVVTRPDRAAGRGRLLASSPVKEIALAHELPLVQPERVRSAEEADGVLGLGPDIIVVASYGQILPRRLLEDPPAGAINLHPSLLPRYRGPSPVAGALLAGDTFTGTTLMRMSPRMDAGPILAQTETEIRPGEPRGDLEERLADLSAALLVEKLPAWFDGELPEVPQDDEEATYTSLLNKEDGQVDWHFPAQEIARAVRAYNPWPMAWTTWAGTQLRIIRASAAEGYGEPGQVLGLAGDSISVAAGKGALEIHELQLAGGRAMSGRALAAGRPAILSAHLGD